MNELPTVDRHNDATKGYQLLLKMSGILVSHILMLHVTVGSRTVLPASDCY